MDYRGTLASLLIFGSIAVYAEIPVKPTEPVIGETQIKLKQRVSEADKEASDSDNDDTENKEDKKPSKDDKRNGQEKEELDPETKALQKKKKKLSMENTLRTEKLKNENADLIARLQKLKWEKDVIKEQLAIEKLKREQKKREATIAHEDELEKITRDSALAKARAAKLSSELSAKKTEWDLEIARLNSEVKKLKAEKERDVYIDSDPVYLEDPLKEDGTLVISDRRIPLNDAIIAETADFITERINYYNNKDKKKPIFIVIDSSPGGSVMAGYRILKAMEGSQAPVYVVLKSYAASMAATMVTLAKKSYAYPNAVMLHHQISSLFFFARMNLTQQKEFYEESKEWWERLAEPVAKKMGITADEFIKRMYKESSDGDWSEFASNAVKLKWVDNIVERIEETSLLKDPNSEKKKVKKEVILAEHLDKNGRPVVYLPRLAPKDMYFLYNPDGYYKLR